MVKQITDKKYSKDYLDKIISENEETIKNLNSDLSEKDIIISRTKSYLFDLEFDLNSAKNKISSLEADLAKNEIEINSKDKKIKNFHSQIEKNKLEINNLLNQINSLDEGFVQKSNKLNGQISSLESELEEREIEVNNLLNQINSLDEGFVQKSNKLNGQISSLESELEEREIEVNNLLNQINSLENELNQSKYNLNIQKEVFNVMEEKYVQKSSKLDANEYCIKCYEEKIINNVFEIEYLKKNGLIKKILNPFSYLYLVFKSKPNEISINFKLYKALKNSKCFDVGYYLNKCNDLVDSKWYKYFSLELHYICNGFDEGREFNKKYFNRTSKKELLEYISKCT